MLKGFLASVPWFLPGVLVAALVGWLVRRRLAGWLGSSDVIAFLTVLAFGIIMAATLTPHRELSLGPEQSAGCDFSRMGLAPWRALRSLNDTSLNIVLFLPLGIMLALLPRSDRKAGLILAAVALPFTIELVQLVLVPLNRACQSADVFDNLTGLVVGLAIGAVLALVRQVASGPDRTGSR